MWYMVELSTNCSEAHYCYCNMFILNFNVIFGAAASQCTKVQVKCLSYFYMTNMLKFNLYVDFVMEMVGLP
jgi:hypothetical protein